MGISAKRCVALAAVAVGLAAPAKAQDAAVTAKFWATCGACHEFDTTGGHSKGPNLWGLMGKTLGAAERFGTYSPAMKAAAAKGIVWTPETLDRWLQNPQAMVPDNQMEYFVESAAERAGIVAIIAASGRR
jgi:cytochrome c